VTKKLSRHRRSFVETLENRQLLSAVVDVRLAGGAKTANVNSVGQVINLEAWVTVTGKDTSPSNDGFQLGQGSFLSTNVSGGAVNGTLKATPAAPFNDLGAHGGKQQDLDGDGDLDVGSNNALVTNDNFAARAGSVIYGGGPVSGGSHSVKIATLTFTVTSLKTGTQTNVVFRPRNYYTAALWTEEGHGTTVDNGSFTGGAAFVIKRGTTTATGSIAGKVFKDANKNNSFDTGDTGLANVKIFIDKDKDGVLDAGEPTFTTSSTGDYKFSGLAAGSYRVREQAAPSGLKVTSPGTSYFDITLAAGQNVTGKNFANQVSATTGGISGKSWNDTNGDGVLNTGETPRSGVRVWLDKNKNGVFDSATEPSKITDASGNYSFTGLAAGSYRVRQLGISGNRISTPSAGYYDLTVGTTTQSGKNFGNTTRVLIKGNVWYDADKDNVHDAGELNLGGWRVFIDKDKDGIFDAGEVSTLTDSSGNYSFKTLAAGNYRVRVVKQTGYSYNNPSTGYHDFTLGSGATTTRNFGLKKP